jgi:hypothetical protein
MSEGNHVQPFVVAILLCDTIIIEENTKKKTLVGIFDRVFAADFPAPHRFAIYVKLVDAAGAYRLRLDYVDVSGDQVMEQLEFGPISIADRLVPSELALTISAPIPRPGAYEFRLFANNSYLGRAPFEAVHVNPQEGLGHAHRG